MTAPLPSARCPRRRHPLPRLGPRRRARHLVLEPDGRTVPLDAVSEAATSSACVEGVGPGQRYRLRLDGGDVFPDPASRFQPEGVHGPSEVVDPAAFDWDDADWDGVAQRDLVFYELHVGTFTPEGTFRAATASGWNTSATSA